MISSVLFALSTAPSVVGLRQTPIACTPSALAAMSPRMRRLAEAQPGIDEGHDDYTPMLNNEHIEIIPELGELVLGERLTRTTSSTVFLLTSHPELVIKFQSNCDQLDAAVHPLLTDFWLSREAGRVNASAKAVFVSPAASLMGAAGRKVDFTMADHTQRNCASRGGVVRFMVMERLDACLDRHSPEPHMERAVLAGAQTIALLERLHRAGIFHGDIHTGNVCLSRSAPGQLRLIDFGQGGFVDSESDELSPSDWWPHELLTAWQLLGFPHARRDDIYRTVEIVARLAVGSSMWAQPHMWAWTNEAKLLDWKQHGSPFVTPVVNAADVIPGLPIHMRSEVGELLDAIVAKARALVSVTTPIPYDSILADLLSVLRIIDAIITTTTVAPTTESSTYSLPILDAQPSEYDSQPRRSALRWLTSWTTWTVTGSPDSIVEKEDESGPSAWCPIPCRRWRSKKQNV